MKGFVKDIESLAIKNSEFRQVLLHSKALPACHYGIKTQGSNRGGST
jgi:hypothetical protein